MGFVLLARPANVMIAMLSVWVGSYLSGVMIPFRIVVACISAGAILAAGNAVNDVFDVEIDRVNQAGRPIPSGVVSRNSASAFAFVLFALGVLLSSLIGLLGLMIALFCSVLLVLYAVLLKRRMLWGNILVSVLTALAFVYGGVAARHAAGALFPAMLAFLFHFGREIIKDVADVKGDRMAHARTLPVVLGERAGVNFAALALGLLIVVTPLPFVLGLYGRLYLIVVLVGVDLVCAVIVAALLSRRAWMSLGRASSLLKADMLLGLAALLVSKV
jgi:geranylgeranylglycerol-phosphate geranylgeranyltransferase